MIATFTHSAIKKIAQLSIGLAMAATTSLSATPLTEAQAIDMFKPLRFYGLKSIPQDVDGSDVLGVHTLSSTGADLRSETLYPPFVLSPRRQTDGMVRQLYSLLPKSLTDTTAWHI